MLDLDCRYSKSRDLFELPWSSFEGTFTFVSTMMRLSKVVTYQL